jgi:methyl-accepting chemotaxis protein
MGLALMSLIMMIGISIGSLLTVRKITQPITEKLDEFTQHSQSIKTQIEALTNISHSIHSLNQQAISLSEKALTSIQRVSAQFQENTHQLNHIAQLTEASKSKAEDGETEWNKIDPLIQVTEDLAFQIRLIALNAEIEAHKSGEQGKGFASIAEALGILANQSVNVIDSITQSIQEQREFLKKEQEKANTGQRSLQDVASINHRMTQTTDEQTTQLTLLEKTIHQLNQLIQTNTTSSESFLNAASQVDEQVQPFETSIQELSELL